MRINIPDSPLLRPSNESEEKHLEEQVSPKSASARPTVLTFSTGTTPSSDTPPPTSRSLSSNKQMGHDPNDRVFPVRSVVSVDVDAVQAPLKSGRKLSQGYEGSLGFSAIGRADSGRSQARHNARIASASSDSRSIKSKGSSTRKSQLSGRSGHGMERAARTSAKDNITETISESPTSEKPDLDRKRTWSGARRPNLDDGVCDAANHTQLFRNAASDDTTEKAESSIMASNTSTSEDGRRSPLDQDTSQPPVVTARFKHVITKEGHAIITGRDGDALQKCEDEPIHIPGAVQSFGLLIAVSEDAEGVLTVRIVSENSHRMIGYTPQELFKLKSFTNILSEEQADNVLDHIDFIRDEEADPVSNGPEVFIITIRNKCKKAVKLWCAMHINPNRPDLVIMEFELDDDQFYPVAPPSDELEEEPENTLDQSPTYEELKESTHQSNKPLRVLRSARKRKGEAAAMEVFNIFSQVQEQLSAAKNLVEFLKVLVGVVKELTGFHRVMIYQFDSSWNGRVVTELVDPRATKDLYYGLNFPASDIPKQARDLYSLNRVRLLYDRDLETSRLVCRTVADLETPLDLSHSYLRAMSPIHIKYLANMAVRSSMSISINAFGELWGLASCHSYGAKGMRVPFPIRKMCRLIGDTASRNIERLSYASRLQARKLINTVSTESNPSGYIIASSDDLLKLFDADFGLLSIRGETRILGKLEHSQEALAMLEYLRMRNINSIITSQDIKQDFPDLRYPPGFKCIAGLLLVPLALGGSDFIVAFRKGQIKDVKWAGNPYEKFTRAGTEGFLEPRKSFKIWSETIVGQCREWTEEQIETAAVLCLVYGKFIEVWRQKEEALHSSQLTKLLLANSAHEVRTPLNAIINYLEIALEGDLDQETRDNLAKSHSASKSLIYVINDLLDLTKTEIGLDLINDEIFDLPSTAKEATEIFKSDARRKGIDYNLTLRPGVPTRVQGDQRKVRQVILNLTVNAMQHTIAGSVNVELLLAKRENESVSVEIVVEDTGTGMSDETLDALFRDLEQVSTGDDIFVKAEQQDQGQVASTTQKKRTLGLGLAVVARIVRNMNGQLRLKSELGHGSRVVVQLPFALPEDCLDAETVSGRSDPISAVVDCVSSQACPKGELMLVDKASSYISDVSGRSMDEVMNITSSKSASTGKSSFGSNKGDIERMIDAIAHPHLMGRPRGNNGPFQQRSQSNDSGHIRQGVASVAHGQPFRTESYDETLRKDHKLWRSKSQSFTVVPQEWRSLPTSRSGGSAIINDSRAPIKAIRVPDEPGQGSPAVIPNGPQTHHPFGFNLPERPKYTETHGPIDEMVSPVSQSAAHLSVLVAEDDPINSRIVMKRLEKAGHEVYLTVNGEECASAYGEKPGFFDVVLMDMQMPIVDGLTSTQMIRSHEKISSPSILSPRAARNRRVPIFAVSASLIERDHVRYIDAGFDGWILKPVDFKRLGVLMTGIVSKETRDRCVYVPGHWENGGWFSPNDSSSSRDRAST